MKIKHKIIIFILAIFFSLNAFAQSAPLRKPELIAGLNNFKEIAFDIRGSRGGNGDVAAGYLTAMDFLRNYSVHSKITFIVDEKSEGILYRISRGNMDFQSSVEIRRAESLPRDKQFDLYLALAGPSGKFYRANDLIDSEEIKLSFAEKYLLTYKKIKMAPNSVLIAQTVLGNTENQSSSFTYGSVRSNGVNYSMGSAGVGRFESGIYGDYVAESLRDKSTEEINKFIFNELPSVRDPYSRYAIEGILKGTLFKNSIFGLAYGVSMRETQSQFISYLDGLPENSTKGFVIVTPSSISMKIISAFEMENRVVVIEPGSHLPAIADPGKIYIVKVRTLPHGIFTGLLARSMSDGLVPVGAGDGFLSAAIKLGKAFVLTGVDWNQENIRNLKERLLVNLGGKDKRLLDKCFGGSYFKDAQLLKYHNDAFSMLSEQIPSLTERIVNAAISVRKISTEFNSPEKIADGISDEVLRNSVRVGGIKSELRIIRQIEGQERNLKTKLFQILNAKIQIDSEGILITFASRDQANFKALLSNIKIGQNFLELFFGKMFEEKKSVSPEITEVKNEYKAEYIKMLLEKATKKKLNSRVLNALKSIFEHISVRDIKKAEIVNTSNEKICSQLFM